MIEFRKSLNLAASQLENHLDYALEEFGQKCVRQGPVPLVPLRDGLGLRLECEKKNQRVKTRPTDYCFVYLRIRGAAPGNDDFAIAASRSATLCCGIALSFGSITPTGTTTASIGLLLTI